MKKFDYYAPQQSWKLPKWLGATIGVIFGGIAIGSGFLILQLTQKPGMAPMAAVGALAPAAQPGTGGVATAQKPQPLSAPVQVSAPVSAEPTAVPEVADSRHHSRHHSRHESKHSSKSANVAQAAPAAPAVSSSERGQILAKHDNKEKRHDKDALDKLLGL